MRKFITLLTTATFFAIACSLIDQLVWHNEFNWINSIIGFATGTALVLLSDCESTKKNAAEA